MSNSNNSSRIMRDYTDWEKIERTSKRGKSKPISECFINIKI